MNGYTILRVELEDGLESAYAEYSSFSIADENDKYRIHVSGYSGTAGKRGIFYVKLVIWTIQNQCLVQYVLTSFMYAF